MLKNGVNWKHVPLALARAICTCINNPLSKTTVRDLTVNFQEILFFVEPGLLRESLSFGEENELVDFKSHHRETIELPPEVIRKAELELFLNQPVLPDRIETLADVQENSSCVMLSILAVGDVFDNKTELVFATLPSLKALLGVRKKIICFYEFFWSLEDVLSDLTESGKKTD